MKNICLWSILCSAVALSPEGAWGNPDAKRLYDDLFKKDRYADYMQIVRPVENSSDALLLKLGLELTQIIDVVEKDQLIAVHVRLVHEWYDARLVWNPEYYGGVNRMYIPAENIWKPDVVLYNNADGDYQVTVMTKAKLYNDGRVLWTPPGIYKSYCPIDVEFFPFDEQNCHMKFGVWTSDGNVVNLVSYINPGVADNKIIDPGINTEMYASNIEWDLLKTVAKRSTKYYPCCPEPYPTIMFNITIRRKTLFYTVNLIIPVVAISFLTVLSFYLPADSGEKITLCVSILLSLSMFLLLLSDLMPPTSLVVPLLGKYLLFTLVMVCVSIILTVLVLNISNRSPTTHTMSPFVRKWFLEKLPKLLLMQRPKKDEPEKEVKKPEPIKVPVIQGISGKDLYEKLHVNRVNLSELQSARPTKRYDKNVERAIMGVKYVADHLKESNNIGSAHDDWKFVAMVIDRLMLWVFTLSVFLGTLVMFLQPPTLGDIAHPIEGQITSGNRCYKEHAHSSTTGDVNCV